MVRGHRIPLLTSAIEPLQRKLGKARAQRLTQALSLVFGTEAFVVLKDIWGLERKGVQLGNKDRGLLLHGRDGVRIGVQGDGDCGVTSRSETTLGWIPARRARVAWV